MDIAERESRRLRAEALVESLTAAGVAGVISTFVDNSGILRLKTTPVRQFPEAAAWGLGFPDVFDRARFDDTIVVSGTGAEPIGDARLMPDVSRVVRLAAQQGWAWAPADRYRQDGTAHPQDSRLLLCRLTDELQASGLTVKCAFEIEWVLSPIDSAGFSPAVAGAAYGMSRFAAASDYCRELLEALHAQEVVVEQLHPEYAAGQFEISVVAESPVGAADTGVLVRSTIRAIGVRHGFRTSFSPKVDVGGVGNGGHCHLSVWRGHTNLMAGGDGAAGMTPDGESFVAGILAHLDALVAIGCPSVASYLRLVPSNWSGDYACWGIENREAAVRLVPGPPESSAWAANVEVKCFDQFANPYLLLAGLLAAGRDGLASHARLPAPVGVDPAWLSAEALAAAGVRRLPTSLHDSTEAFVNDHALTEAFGAELVASLAAIHASELEMFAEAAPEAIAAANLWRY
jgi:glutamine synthetase